MNIVKIEAPLGYWRVATVAYILNVSLSTVRSWIRDQRLLAQKCWGVYLIPDSELQRFIARYSRSSKPWAVWEDALKDLFPSGIEL